jgi:tetratricopeptide (TPR) repeat protein
MFSGRTLAERYLERGLFHLDKKKYEDALADLTSAIGEEPYNAELYATRGFIYLESNKESYLEFARSDFEYALFLDPAQWVAEYCLGMIAFAEEDYVLALQRFSSAREHAPDHAEPYYYRAVCLYHLGHPVQALADMEQAIIIFAEQKDSRKRFATKWKTLLKRAVKDLPPGAADHTLTAGNQRVIDSGG